MCLTALVFGCASTVKNADSVTPEAKANVYDPKFPIYGKLPPQQTGDMGYVVEKLAKNAGCAPAESAALMSKRPGIQFYKVACADGSQRLYKCEMRNCGLSQ